MLIAKGKIGTTLRITKKNFQDELSHELFLRKRQKVKMRNILATNMPTDIKRCKPQLSKIIGLGRFFGKTLSSVIGNTIQHNIKALLDLAVPLVKDVLPKLAVKATSSLLDKFERTVSRKGVVRVEKWFTLFISNEDIDNIISPSNLTCSK